MGRDLRAPLIPQHPSHPIRLIVSNNAGGMAMTMEAGDRWIKIFMDGEQAIIIPANPATKPTRNGITKYL